MEGKLTLYDMLAAVIPGGILLVSITVLFSMLPVQLPTGITGGITGTTVFLVIAYFLGQFIQGIGKWYERTCLIPAWGGFPSVRFLREGDSKYSAEFRNKLMDAIFNCFKIDLRSDTENQDLQDKRIQEAFNLCYSYVLDNGLVSLVSVMNATYGLFRGLVVSSRLSALSLLACGAIVALHEQWDSTILFASLALFMIWAGAVFRRRTKQRGEYFADHIYRAFLSEVSTTESRGKL